VVVDTVNKTFGGVDFAVGMINVVDIVETVIVDGAIQIFN